MAFCSRRRSARCDVGVFSLWAMLSLGTSFATAQAQTPPAPDDPIRLPAYILTADRELPPAEKWLYARVGGIEIISSASEGTTRHLVADFQRFCQALDLVWPDAQRANARLGRLILCGRAGEFQRFAPVPEAGKSPALMSFALREPEHSTIVLDLATRLLSGANAAQDEVATISANGERELQSAGDSYRQLYRTYVRFLLAAAQPRAPAWFEEGLAQLLMSIQVSDREVVVGQLQDPNETREADGSAISLQDLDFNAVFKQRRLLPMGKLLEAGHDSEEARNATGNRWAKQAYAFVHWGLYGDEGRHQKAFVTFLARLAKQPLSEELFQGTFRKNYEQMGLTLLAYVEITSHRIAGVEAEKGYKLPLAVPFELRGATESEAARLAGETLLASGKLERARQTMALPYRRGSRDADLLAAIGLLELRANEPAAARKFLELAANGKPARPRALVELAKLRLAEIPAGPASGSQPAAARLSAPQLAGVLTPLFAARALTTSAATPELYETIARTWEKSAFDPEPEHLGVLDEGVRLFPREAELVYRTAALKARIGLHAEAAALIAIGLQHTTDAGMRTRLVALQASLPGASK